MLFLLNETLCRVMDQMFLMDFSAEKSNRKNCLPECEEIMAFIHFHGRETTGEICLSMSHDCCRKMLESTKVATKNLDYEDLMRQTLGEVSNVVAGEFLSLPEVTKSFGEVEIHPPLILDDKLKVNPDFPIVLGDSGKIKNNANEISTFISDALYCPIA